MPRAKPRKNNLNELRNFLKKEKKVRSLLKRKPIIKRVKRSYADSHVLLVVKLRYGCSNDYLKVWNRWNEISKMTGIS